MAAAERRIVMVVLPSPGAHAAHAGGAAAVIIEMCEWELNSVQNYIPDKFSEEIIRFGNHFQAKRKNSML